ncbi:hypothetical protein GQ44DRAFT_786390 [Phaeosphaeriaceae sp. PMI808]|nr:hypothetical protein GQ44DRAFT_786390 [Phaeosphaeriaceae sp. PMI808]
MLNGAVRVRLFSTSLVQPMITTVLATTLQRNPEQYYKNLSKLRNAGVVTRVVAPLACNWSIVLATVPHYGGARQKSSRQGSAAH